MVYVDDFKMAGPAEAVKRMWGRFESLPEDVRIELGEAAPAGHFLGCQHTLEEWPKQVIEHPGAGSSGAGSSVPAMATQKHRPGS